MDGNGRVGRILMAAQCGQRFQLSLAETITQLEYHDLDYARIHVSTRKSPQRAEIRFELLIDLLAQMLPLPQSGEVKLPYPVEPKFPQTNLKKLPSISYQL